MLSGTAIGGIIGAAILGSTALLHFSAEQRWKSVTSTHPWLSHAREAVGLPTWLSFQFRNDADIVALAAPLAVGQLSAVPLEISSADAMPQAKHLVSVSNDLMAACGDVPGEVSIQACSRSGLDTHFASFERAFARVPQLADDFYLLRKDSRIAIRQLTLFSATFCNHDPSNVNATVSVSYNPEDRQQANSKAMILAPGECAEGFRQKLRQAPRLQVDAAADPGLSEYLQRIPRYRQVWSDRAPEWRDQVEFTATANQVRRSFDNPGLCYGGTDAVCTESRIADKASYAKALNASLRTESKFTAYPADGLYRFHIGATFSTANNRDEFGALVTSVESGGAAEAAGLKPGDRILALGGQAVFTAEDVISVVNETGDATGYESALGIEVLRGSQTFAGEIAIAYNKAFFDALGYTYLTAAFHSFLDFVTFGLGKYANCWVIQPAARFVGLSNDRSSTEDCQRQWERDGPVLRKLYWDGFALGGFIAALISPLQYLPNLLISRTLFGASRIGAVFRGAAVLATEQVLSQVNNTVAGTNPVEPLRIAPLTFTARRSY
jgi:hypothetical protein